MIELLVVIAIIGVLAALLLPALSHAKERGHLALCLNNFRNLQQGWQMYANDNADEAVDSYAVGDEVIQSEKQIPNAWWWVSGEISYDPNSYDNFNTLNLVDAKYSALAPYIQNPAIYKCSSDYSTALWQGRSLPRLRSYSYSDSWDAETAVTDADPFENRVHHTLPNKTYSVHNLSAAITFIEQHEDSLGLPWFHLLYLSNGASGQVCDIPASRHDGNCAFAFGDGHVEKKKWVDPRTRVPVLKEIQQYYHQSAFPNNPDLDWLAERRVLY